MTQTRLFRGTAALALVAALAVPVGACSTHSADTYSRDEMGQAMTVTHGTVVSVRQVKVEGTQSGVGAASGAAIGGVGGYQVGGDRSVNIIGAIGGAVIGGLIGLAAEKGLTSDTAEEVIVRQDDGTTRAYIQKMDDPNALQPGDRVLIMRGDKTRVVKDPANTPPPAVAPAPSAAPAPGTPSSEGSWQPPADGDALRPVTIQDGRA